MSSWERPSRSHEHDDAPIRSETVADLPSRWILGEADASAQPSGHDAAEGTAHVEAAAGTVDEEPGGAPDAEPGGDPTCGAPGSVREDHEDPAHPVNGDAPQGGVEDDDGAEGDQQCDDEPGTSALGGEVCTSPEADLSDAGCSGAAGTGTNLEVEAPPGSLPEVGTEVRPEVGAGRDGDVAGLGANQVAGLDTAPDAATKAAPAPTEEPGPAAPPGRRFGLFPRSARSKQRRLTAHILDTYAGRPAAARKVDAALATVEPADTTGSVTAYRAELADLIANGPVLPQQQVHTLLREAGVVGSVRAMEDTPAAAGAIAQVHRGEWMDGTPVAVKVMRPGVWQTLPTELAHLTTAASALVRHLPGHDIPGLLRQLRAAVPAELDFATEAARQHAFYSAFTDTPHVSVPRVRLVGPTVLVTDWADGVPLEVAPALAADQRAALAEALATFTVTGIVETGMVHGDPHPGNVLVHDATIVPVDFARSVPVPVKLPDATSVLVRAISTDDAEAALCAFRDLGLTTSKSTLKAADALTAATDLLGPLTGAPVTVDAALLTSLTSRHRLLRGMRPSPALEATLRAVTGTLALVARLNTTVDMSAALAPLPGLDVE